MATNVRVARASTVALKPVASAMVMSADKVPTMPRPKLSRGWLALAVIGAVLLVVSLVVAVRTLWEIGLQGLRSSSGGAAVAQGAIAASAALAAAVAASITTVACALMSRRAQADIAQYAHDSARILQAQSQDATSSLEEKKMSLLKELEEYKNDLQAKANGLNQVSEALMTMTVAASAYYRELQQLSTGGWEPKSVRASEKKVEDALGQAKVLLSKEESDLYEELLQVGYSITDTMKHRAASDGPIVWVEKVRALGMAMKAWERLLDSRRDQSLGKTTSTDEQSFQ